MVMVGFNVRAVELARFRGPDGESIFVLLRLGPNTLQLYHHGLDAICLLLPHPRRVSEPK